MAEHKIIQDPVHGSIKVDDIILPLMGTLEFERLRHIKQLGLASLVFPGANHTRMSHSLGTSHIARGIARAIGLDEYEQRLLGAAGLLHDLGHGPFSHVTEFVLHLATGMDHMDITKKIILGDLDPVVEGEREQLPVMERIPDILDRFEIDPKEVAALIDEKEPAPDMGQDTLPVENGQGFFKTDKSYLKQIIHGTVDADQIDYLLRDSYYTGVAYGIIDLDRIMKTVVRHHNEILIEKSGISAIEGLLVARTLMYTSVYFHKTTRIAEQMLARAVELAADKLTDLPFMTDFDLMRRLYEIGGIQRNIITRIKYRQIYKPAFMLYSNDMTDEIRERLLELSEHSNKREAEQFMCQRLGLDDGSVIIDVPNKELLLSEPRINKTAIKILDRSGKVSTLNSTSPLARAIQLRQVPDWVISISVPAGKRNEARNIAKRIIFS